MGCVAYDECYEGHRHSDPPPPLWERFATGSPTPRSCRGVGCLDVQCADGLSCGRTGIGCGSDQAPLPHRGTDRITRCSVHAPGDRTTEDNEPSSHVEHSKAHADCVPQCIWFVPLSPQPHLRHSETASCAMSTNATESPGHKGILNATSCPLIHRRGPTSNTKLSAKEGPHQ